MGRYKKGILGYFRGKVGTVGGAVMNGIYYMRSLPDFGEDNPTVPQINVRLKMALIGGWLIEDDLYGVGVTDYEYECP